MKKIIIASIILLICITSVLAYTVDISAASSKILKKLALYKGISEREIISEMIQDREQEVQMFEFYESEEYQIEMEKNVFKDELCRLSNELVEQGKGEEAKKVLEKLI